MRITNEDGKPSEAQIQAAFIAYVAAMHPDLVNLLIHIPNEGKRSWAEGKKQKSIGLRKGCPDLFFMRGRMEHRFMVDGNHEEMRHYNGLWLEIKRHDGKESREQKEFAKRAIWHGYEYKCCYSLDQAIEVFEEYIKD